MTIGRLTLDLNESCIDDWIELMNHYGLDVLDDDIGDECRISFGWICTLFVDWFILLVD